MIIIIVIHNNTYIHFVIIHRDLSNAFSFSFLVVSVESPVERKQQASFVPHRPLITALSWKWSIQKIPAFFPVVSSFVSTFNFNVSSRLRACLLSCECVFNRGCIRGFGDFFLSDVSGKVLKANKLFTRICFMRLSIALYVGRKRPCSALSPQLRRLQYHDVSSRWSCSSQSTSFDRKVFVEGCELLSKCMNFFRSEQTRSHQSDSDDPFREKFEIGEWRVYP